MTADVLERLFGVRDKAVLVTGGSRGIGLGIADGFVRAGARVYVCSRDADACRAAAEKLSEFGRCTAIAANVGTAAGRDELVATLSGHEDALHVLVNNAGAIWAAPFDEYPESGWDKVFDLNVKGGFYLTRALGPLLRRAATPEDPARVINIGSIDGFHVPRHETYAYSASKAAVHQLSRHLAHQLAPHHITVNVIAPGLFPSKMLRATLEQRGEAAVVAPIPLKRLADDADVAGTALYLASRAGAYVTGAVLPVDGGMATTL